MFMPRITHNGKLKSDGKQISVHFNSMLDILEFDTSLIDEQFSNRIIWKNYLIDNKRKCGTSDYLQWYGPGNKSCKDVIDKAIYGNLEGLKITEQYKTQLKGIIPPNTALNMARTRTKRKAVKGYQGDELDIHKVYQGNLDKAWTYRKKIEQEQKINLVNVVLDITAGYHIPCVNTFYRAAIAMMIIDELQKHGKSCKLTVCMSLLRAFNRGEQISTFSVVVKEYNQDLMPAKIAAICNVGFSRCVIFPLYHLCNYEVKTSYGTIINVSDYQPLHLKEEVEAGHSKFIFINQCNNLVEAKSVLLNTVKQMNLYN